MAKRNLPLGGATPMEPGERDRRVTIQQLTAGKAGSGYPKDTWTPLRTVWMRVLELRASERFKASQNAAAVDTQFEMGYAADMDPDLLNVPKVRRLLYKGRTHDITSASMIGRREGIEFLTIAQTRVAS
jgi:SPP1 family predicted phage head-tail adaptor